MKIEALANYIKKHGLPAIVEGEQITTLDVWTHDGKGYSTPIRIDGNLPAVRAFLGY